MDTHASLSILPLVFGLEYTLVWLPIKLTRFTSKSPLDTIVDRALATAPFEYPLSAVFILAHVNGSQPMYWAELSMRSVAVEGLVLMPIPP